MVLIQHSGNEGSACAFAQSDLSLHCSLTESKGTVRFIDQSDHTYAQSGLSFAVRVLELFSCGTYEML